MPLVSRSADRGEASGRGSKLMDSCHSHNSERKPLQSKRKKRKGKKRNKKTQQPKKVLHRLLSFFTVLRVSACFSSSLVFFFFRLLQGEGSAGLGGRGGLGAGLGILLICVDFSPNPQTAEGPLALRSCNLYLVPRHDRLWRPPSPSDLHLTFIVTCSTLQTKRSLDCPK